MDHCAVLWIAIMAAFARAAESSALWDWRNSIDILEELASVRANLTGVSIATGPHSISPALYFIGDNRSIRLPETSFGKVTTLLQSYNEITFLASVRQEPQNTGTIFSISQGFTRFLELQSSGRRDEVRLHYTHQGLARVETFRYRLADGVWHKVAVSVSGGVVSLYVDCKKVERHYLSFLPDTSLTTLQGVDLWVGQRAEHFLFKGALQDVKLMGGPNALLTQCSQAEPECPSCGEFRTLQSMVVKLEKALQQLTDKLEEAEERISKLEQCDCPRSCEVNGTVRTDGSSWQSGCDICSCTKGEVQCHAIKCPAAPCKNPVWEPGMCCPTCLPKCYMTGVLYEHGETVSPHHCLECRCHNGSMSCNKLEPELHCPPLPCPESEQFSVHGECCKFCPGVDYCGVGNDCHAQAQCLNLRTKYACRCLPGFTGDGKQCTDIDECLGTDGPDGNRCGPFTECVNTVGSYECQCLPGYSRLDNYTCVEHDECTSGTHTCSPHAKCHNTAGGFRCTCTEGYAGNGFNCTPICEQPCQNGGLCVAPNTCQCRLGFSGASCESDLDECVAQDHQCHPHSDCKNMPGWYTCPCKPGFRSPFEDTSFGALCQDINECAEGLHSCHGNSVCVNTIGGYECQCPSSTPNCSQACLTPDGLKQNGQQWVSSQSSCSVCTCREGVSTCSPITCNCSALNKSRFAGFEPCCPQCSQSKSRGSTCSHQELPQLKFGSGQKWIYQCQTCECLHGEVDCWPLECPPLYCHDPIIGPGDCCPRCRDHDPCRPETEPNFPANSTACHYRGRNFTEGSEWAASLDGCTTCKCKEPYCQRLLGIRNSAASSTNWTGRFAAVWILAALASFIWPRLFSLQHLQPLQPPQQQPQQPGRVTSASPNRPWAASRVAGRPSPATRTAVT